VVSDEERFLRYMDSDCQRIALNVKILIFDGTMTFLRGRSNSGSIKLESIITFFPNLECLCLDLFDIQATSRSLQHSALGNLKKLRFRNISLSSICNILHLFNHVDELSILENAHGKSSLLVSGHVYVKELSISFCTDTAIKALADILYPGSVQRLNIRFGQWLSYVSREPMKAIGQVVTCLNIDIQDLYDSMSVFYILARLCTEVGTRLVAWPGIIDVLTNVEVLQVTAVHLIVNISVCFPRHQAID
jgi:hypothetical protein